MSKIRKKAKTASQRAAGEVVTALGDRYALIRTRQPEKVTTAKSDTAREMLNRAGKALDRPGIKSGSVFRGSRTGVFAYSVYGPDPSKVVRKAADGTRTIGRFVDGRFRAR